MDIIGSIIIGILIVTVVYVLITYGFLVFNGEPKSNFQDHKQCKGIAKRVWDDIYNNDTLTFNTFEEYWEYLTEKHNL